MERDEILAQIRKYMAALFDTPEESIVPDADLAQDLDLDSIDAVDLVVELQKLTGNLAGSRLMVNSPIPPVPPGF